MFGDVVIAVLTFYVNLCLMQKTLVCEGVSACELFGVCEGVCAHSSPKPVHVISLSEYAGPFFCLCNIGA